MLKLLNRTELLLGIYIALYVAIPANGIDAIFGFNIQVIFFGSHFVILSIKTIATKHF